MFFGRNQGLNQAQRLSKPPSKLTQTCPIQFFHPVKTNPTLVSDQKAQKPKGPRSPSKALKAQTHPAPPPKPYKAFYTPSRPSKLMLSTIFRPVLLALIALSISLILNSLNHFGEIFSLILITHFYFHLYRFFQEIESKS